MYTLSSSSFCYFYKTYHMRYSIYFPVRWQMQKGCNSFPLTFIYEHSRTGTRSKGDVTEWLGKLNYFAAFIFLLVTKNSYPCLQILRQEYPFETNTFDFIQSCYISDCFYLFFLSDKQIFSAQTQHFNSSMC